MYFSLSIILSVLLSYCTVFSAAASADCFRQEGTLEIIQSNITSRISAGVACSKAANQSCLLESDGLVSAPSTLNITTAHTAEVFDAIGKAVNSPFPFNESGYGDVSRMSISIGPGENGYISYNLYLRCYDGVIENECFDDIPAGMPVKACQPWGNVIISGEVFPRLNSTFEFVPTDEATALNMTDNPAAALKAEVDSGTANGTGSDTASGTGSGTASGPDSGPDSGAVKLLGQGGWWSSMVMMTVVMTTMGIGSLFFAI